MNIISAQFADSVQRSVELITVESGAVLIDLDGPDVSRGWREIWKNWGGETEAFSPIFLVSLDIAKAHVSRSFDPLELLTLKDWKDSLPVESTPKLQSCYAWIQSVISLAASGATDFPPAPHAFAEVLTEISTLLNS